MGEGLTTPLLAGGFWVAVLGTLILYRRLPMILALPVCLLKAGLVVAYFSSFYNANWTVFDDMTYYQEGIRLVQSGYNPITVLTQQEGRDDLVRIAGGYHTVYYWYNLTALSLFGIHYYAPIFLNVIMTVIAAVFFDLILGRFGYDPVYRRWVILWQLLHPDLLAWSSFVNLKDILCMTLSVMNFYAVICLLEKYRFRHLLLYAFTVFIFFFLRFYIPFLIVASTALWLAIQGGGIRKWFLMGMYVGALWLIRARAMASMSQFGSMGILQSGVQFILTPRPWAIEPNYTFLFIPSVLHWLLAFPCGLAALQLWFRSGQARLLIIYFLAVVAFFCMIPSLGGPRHRVQADFVIAWLQFHFFWSVWHGVRGHTGAAAPAAA